MSRRSVVSGADVYTEQLLALAAITGRAVGPRRSGANYRLAIGGNIPIVSRVRLRVVIM